MRITAHIGAGERENEKGQLQKTTIATCSKCGNSTWAWGTSDASRKRCLANLNETCPNGDNNFYVG